jgi:hypothetical protein
LACAGKVPGTATALSLDVLVLFGGRARPSVAQLFKLLYRRFSTGNSV